VVRGVKRFVRLHTEVVPLIINAPLSSKHLTALSMLDCMVMAARAAMKEKAVEVVMAAQAAAKGGGGWW
jgi:hypothetical protein